MPVNSRFARAALVLVIWPLLAGVVACWATFPRFGDILPRFRSPPALPAKPLVWSSLPTPAIIRPHWTSFTNANSINALAPRDRLLWAATEGGVVAWDPHTGRSVKFNVEHGLAGNRVTSAAITPDGLAWFGTGGQGIGRYDGRQWKTFTTRDGLASNTVRDLVVGEDGALWAATSRGISRFDGRRWQTFSVPGPNPGEHVDDVRALAPAPQGIWAATARGVGFFNGQQWRTFTFRDGLANDDTNAVVVAPDRSVWIGTRVGLSHFDGAHWEKLTTADGLQSNTVTSLAVSPDGTLWIGYGDAAPGLTRFTGQSWQTFRSANGAPIGSVRSIASDASTGTVWVGTPTGVLRFDGYSWRSYSLPSELPSNDVRGLLATRGAVWVASGAGISRFAGGRWQQFTTADGLPSNDVRALAPGPDGTPWAAFTTPAYGVARLAPGDAWETISCRMPGPYSPNVNAGALAPDGSVWFATDQGVTRLAHSRWDTFTAANGLPDNRVKSLAVAPSGEVWAGTSRGLAVYSSGRWATVVPDDVEQVAVSPAGEVWVVTPVGIARLDGDRLAGVSGAPTGNVRKLVATRDSVWAATPGGVIRYDATGWRTFTTADGLASNDVSTLAMAPDGTLWVAFVDGRLGFNHFDGTRWRSLTETSLPDDQVSAVLTTPSGEVWVATPSGLVRMQGSHLQTYTTSDGLPSTQIHAMAHAFDSVWVATAGGVARFDGQWWQAFSTADGLAAEDVRALAVAPDGRLWAGFKNVGEGISVYDGTRWSTHHFASYGGETGPGVMAVDPRGALWVASDAGLAWFDDERWQFLPSVPDANGRAVAVNDLSRMLFSPDGSLWLQAPDHVLRHDGREWTKLDARDGSGFEAVSDVLVARDGMTWLGTLEGIQRFDGSSWRLFTTDEGLPDNHVRSLAEGVDGSIWAATRSGVVRYHDGEWRSFSSAHGVPPAGVEKLAVTGDGSVWALGTGPSLSRYDGTAWAGVALPQGATPSELLPDRSGGLWIADPGDGAWLLARYAEGKWTRFLPNGEFPETRLLDLGVAPDGAVWVITDAGLRRHVEGRWEPVPFPGRDAPRSMVFSPDGTTWFATERGWIWQYREGRWQGQPSTRLDPGAEIEAMEFSTDGRLWVGGRYASSTGYQAGFLAAFDGSEWTPVPVPSLNGESRPVEQITRSPEGHLWVTSDRVHLLGADGAPLEMDTSDLPWLRYLKEFQGTLAFGADGSVWFAERRSNSVYRFNGRSWTNIQSPIGWDADVTGMAVAPDGTLWVATKAGAAHFANGQWRTFHSAEAVFGSVRSVRAMTVASDGSIWYALLGGGTKRYHPAQSRYQGYRVILPKYETQDVVQSADGGLWLSTRGGGVARLAGATPVHWELYSPDPVITSEAVQGMAIAPDGEVWLGTPSGMVQVGSEDCTVVNRLGRRVNALTAVADSSGEVWIVTESQGVLRAGREGASADPFVLEWRGRPISTMTLGPDGEIWFASEEGLAHRIDEGWETLPVDPRLVSGKIVSLAVGPDHSVWLATEEGVVRYNGQRWDRFTTADGLGDDTVRYVLAAPDGSVWFATPGGLSRYRP